MSERAKEWWHTSVREGDIYYEDGAQAVRLSEAHVDRLGIITDRIIADHNACLGIEDSETTVPELVAACKQSKEAMAKAFSELLHSNTASYVMLKAAYARIGTLLAKTGKPT